MGLAFLRIWQAEALSALFPGHFSRTFVEPTALEGRGSVFLQSKGQHGSCLLEKIQVF